MIVCVLFSPKDENHQPGSFVSSACVCMCMGMQNNCRRHSSQSSSTLECIHGQKKGAQRHAMRACCACMCTIRFLYACISLYDSTHTYLFTAVISTALYHAYVHMQGCCIGSPFILTHTNTHMQGCYIDSPKTMALKRFQQQVPRGQIRYACCVCVCMYVCTMALKRFQQQIPRSQIRCVCLSCVCIYIYIHTYTYTYINMCTHAHNKSLHSADFNTFTLHNSVAYIPRHTYKNIHIHAKIHTYTHKTHTYIYTAKSAPFSSRQHAHVTQDEPAENWGFSTRARGSNISVESAPR
jgi:hypothetical protein